MDLKLPIILSIMLLIICVGGCSIPDPPSSATLVQPDYIRITEIAVRNETELSFLEIEVHIFTESDNTFLGCSGGDDGLQRVDVSDSLYKVKAFFRGPEGLLTYGALKNSQVYLEVIEDDVNPCPFLPELSGPVLNVDDFVGRSQPFPGAILNTPQVFQFNDVTHLKMVNSPLP